MPQSHTPALARAVYIGPEVLADKLAKMYQNTFNFVAQVPDIASFWLALEEGRIDNEKVEAIITVDIFFDPTSQVNALEQFVATLSSYCFLGIIKYRDTPNSEAEIREAVRAAAYQSSGAESDDPLYYFIDRTAVKESTRRAINHYVRSDQRDPIVANILMGKDPYDGIETAEEAHEVSTESYDFEEEEKSDYMGRVIAVTSSKGGSGKSTVALTLATCIAHASENSVKEGLADRPLKIVVLDLDVRDGQIGFLTGASQPTVLHMRMNGISVESLEETVHHDHRLKLDIILAPRKPRMSDDTPAEFYLELIQLLKKQYDFVFLDTSVNYLDPLLEKVAYPIADQIIFVTDIVINSVFSMTRWIQEVTKPREKQGMGISKNKIGIVVNKTMKNISMSFDTIRQGAQGLPLVAIVPNNAKLMAHCANLQSMQLSLRHNDIKWAFQGLAKSIVGGTGYKLSDNLEP